MAVINRRTFLKSAGSAIGSLAVASALRPSLLLAQSPGGSGKNVVVLNLLGGFDGLFGIPYFQGEVAQAINSLYRPDIRVVPGTVLSVGNQNGLPNRIGLNPAWSAFHQVAANRIKLIQNYGIPGDPGRSHDTCQIIMSLGGTQIEGGEMVGFLARLMDSQHWETFQYWSLANTNPSDTATRLNPPVAVTDLSQLAYPAAAFEREDDKALANAIQQQLVELQVPRDTIETRYKSQLQSMHQIVSKVRTDIAIQSVGAYDNAPGIATNLRDAAKILRAKSLNQGIDGNKNTLILTAQGGYDFHGGIITQAIGGESMGYRIQSLARNLKVFYQDLERFGILDKTVVVLYSEFGRTVRQNQSGNVNPDTIGSDHGHGNNTLVFGGPITGGAIGTPPSVSSLGSEYNALIPSTDYRHIFSEVFSWIGVNPSEIFPPPYAPQSIGLMA